MSIGWRGDLDSLAFDLPSGGGACVVHRRAFRPLLNGEPTPAACLQWAQRNRSALDAAAFAKMERKGLAKGARFHLTSRDIRRAMAQAGAGAPATAAGAGATVAVGTAVARDVD